MIYGFHALKTRFVFLSVVVCALAACGLFDEQKGDYASVQRAGVLPAIYDKMMHGDRLSVGDVVALSRAGVSDAVIVRYIRDNHTVYNLTARDFARLQQGGVSSSVVDFMVHSGYRSPDAPWGP
jgi:hypothetical protein